MIPCKIISFEEAVNLGLTSGAADVGIMNVIVKVPKDKKHHEGQTVEKSWITNGEHHLLFMDEDRKTELKKKGDYEDYLDQFNQIEGETKEKFFQKNNLKLKETFK